MTIIASAPGAGRGHSRSFATIPPATTADCSATAAMPSAAIGHIGSGNDAGAREQRPRIDERVREVGREHDEPGRDAQPQHHGQTSTRHAPPGPAAASLAPVPAPPARPRCPGPGASGSDQRRRVRLDPEREMPERVADAREPQHQRPEIGDPVARRDRPAKGPPVPVRERPGPEQRDERRRGRVQQPVPGRQHRLEAGRHVGVRPAIDDRAEQQEGGQHRDRQREAIDAFCCCGSGTDAGPLADPRASARASGTRRIGTTTISVGSATKVTGDGPPTAPPAAAAPRARSGHCRTPSPSRYASAPMNVELGGGEPDADRDHDDERRARPRPRRTMQCNGRDLQAGQRHQRQDGSTPARSDSLPVSGPGAAALSRWSLTREERDRQQRDRMEQAVTGAHGRRASYGRPVRRRWRARTCVVISTGTFGAKR